MGPVTLFHEPRWDAVVVGAAQTKDLDRHRQFECRAGASRDSSRPRPEHTNGAPGGPSLSPARHAVHGDPELLDRVVTTFLEECPRLIDEMERSLEAGDMAGVRRAAHTIKCSLRLFGVSPGHEIAARLQQTNGRNDFHAPRLLAALRHEFERARRMLDPRSSESK